MGKKVRRQRSGKKPAGPRAKNDKFDCIAIAKRFRATIALALILVVAYFLLSQGNLFIQKSLLSQLSFSLAKPLNFIAYTVSHMSLWHLAANLVSLLFFSAIVELSLKWKHVLGIFLFSAVLTVLIFSFLNPFSEIAGASAGVWGLMAAAFVLDVKKAALAMAAVIVLILLLFAGIELVVSQRENSLVQKNVEIETALAEAVESGNVGRANQLAAERVVAARQLENFTESSESAAEANLDMFLHSYAGILGIAYLLLFRQEETKKAIKKHSIFPRKKALRH
jgi:membrane associated rhomboid family serine protease